MNAFSGARGGTQVGSEGETGRGDRVGGRARRAVGTLGRALGVAAIIGLTGPPRPEGLPRVRTNWRTVRRVPVPPPRRWLIACWSCRTPRARSSTNCSALPAAARGGQAPRNPLADAAVAAANETMAYADYQTAIESPLKACLAADPTIDFIVLTKGIPIRLRDAPLGVSGNSRRSIRFLPRWITPNGVTWFRSS